MKKQTPWEEAKKQLRDEYNKAVNEIMEGDFGFDDCYNHITIEVYLIGKDPFELKEQYEKCANKNLVTAINRFIEDNDY